MISKIFSTSMGILLKFYESEYAFKPNFKLNILKKNSYFIKIERKK